MFPFWEVAIAPVLDAAGAKRITEIGALAGQNTELMLERLGPEAELHVIDPIPQFDPSEHEKRFGGRYIFHRDLSLNVLPALPTMDAVLVDGDHNWFTVYNELTQVRDVARAEGQPLPILVLHDVGWPYGRRDLYYAPEQIPEEYRQPWAERGMMPGRSELLEAGGGMNPALANALTEGGPRNGVMTAVDDFIAEHDKPLRLVVLPIYFGLAILVEDEVLDAKPDVARVLDELEGVERRTDLLEMAESTRIQNIIFQHNVFYSRDQQLRAGAERYLTLLRKALLDEHYLENEVRIDYLLLCIEQGRPVDPRKIRDPKRLLKDRLALISNGRRDGSDADGGKAGAGFFPYTSMGSIRMEHLHACLDTIREERVQGDLVDCGTGRGGGAIFMRGYLDAHLLPDAKVWVVDPFKAARAPIMPNKRDIRHPRAWLRRVRRGQLLAPVPGGFGGLRSLLPDLNNVREAFSRFDLLDKRVRFIQGPPVKGLGKARIDKIALLRIGVGHGDDAADLLDRAYDRVSVGGFVIVDDYADPACARAIDAFRERRGIAEPLERVDARGAVWRKLEESRIQDSAGSDATDEGGLEHAPLAPPAPTTRKDLTVVVVFYNMKREAERTLTALSRSYQEGIDDLDYEVIAVENGSDPEQRLGAEYVRSFGPEFRYIDMGETATHSPIPALNRGIEAGHGDAYALMIDGAHVITPGVMRFAMQALDAYEPAIVATQQWYVGPGQQGDLLTEGYDQDMEDELFERVGWPTDGYRLFDIGHFIGERDWFDGLWESNCLFAPRALLEQVGGFDDSFDMAGGGYANLEIFERLGASPDVTVATLIGEGSFHQIHQGTTTNQTEIDRRHDLIAGYAEHYTELRGRQYSGPAKPIHYVGQMREAARRTRSRRFTAPEFWKPGGTEGLPTEPRPVPEELATAFTEAFFENLAWKNTTWLGHRVDKAPTDLIAYQEVLAQVRPDWVIVTRPDGSALPVFFAGLCDLLGHGQVLAVDADGPAGPSHDRLQWVTGEPGDEATVAKVAELVGDDPKALVVLGGPTHRSTTYIEFEAYADFVPVGSYVIVEFTAVNGFPVWPGHGAGPQEAVRLVRENHPEFLADLSVQKYWLTLNPGGYLKRVE